MVLEAHPHQQPQPQQPVMRDFLGLGKLAKDDSAEGKSLREEPYFQIRDFPPPSSDMDCTGAKYPMFINIGSLAEHNFSQRKVSDGRYLEGSAETFGLSCTNMRRQSMAPDPTSLDANVKPSSMQLTIFYGGHVNVYNNIPVDRAEAIMHLAAKDDSLPQNVPTLPSGVSRTLATPGFCQPMAGAENLCFNVAQMGPPFHFTTEQGSQNCPPANRLFECPTPNTASTATSPEPVVPRALPLARKASLARFLEKRKERMQMMSPYLKKQPARSQQAEQMVASSVPNATLSEFYEQYFRRSAMIYCMQEQADMSSSGTPAKN